MKTLICIIACLFIFDVTAYSQSNDDKEAVRNAILDYVEGVYEVAPERIRRSVHPDLFKRGFNLKKGEATYSFMPMTFEQLVSLAGTYNKDGKIPKNAPKDIVVFDVLDRTASAKLTADWGVDYFHLVKVKSKWMIANILWQGPPASGGATGN
jgi:hypothetical protein